MKQESTYQWSNLASGIFIDLTVADGEDSLAVARAHLSQTQLPMEVQHGFFLSLYPVDPPAEAAPEHSSSVPETPNSERTRAAAETSPLDAAAAEGPLDWSEADAAPDPTEEEHDSSLPAVQPIVGFGLGSAGGH